MEGRSDRARERRREDVYHDQSFPFPRGTQTLAGPGKQEGIITSHSQARNAYNRLENLRGLTIFTIESTYGTHLSSLARAGHFRVPSGQRDRASDEAKAMREKSRQEPKKGGFFLDPVPQASKA